MNFESVKTVVSAVEPVFGETVPIGDTPALGLMLGAFGMEGSCIYFFPIAASCA